MNAVGRGPDIAVKRLLGLGDAWDRLSADHPIDRNEDVLPPVGAVLEYRVQRHVPAADVDARMVGRNQRAGDAEVFLVAEQMVGVENAKGEAEKGRHGPQRDVALVPGEFEPERLPPLVLPSADDAGVGNRRGIGARVGIGQREAWNFRALGETR